MIRFRCRRCGFIEEIGKLQTLKVRRPDGRITECWECTDQEGCLRRSDGKRPDPDGEVLVRYNPETGRLSSGENLL